MPKSQTNWNTLGADSATYGPFISAGGAQNAQLSWDVDLDVGTWTFGAIFVSDTNCGIVTLNLDEESAGTIDTYAAATSRAVRTITGIVVASAGIHTVQLILATKNASSTGYRGVILGPAGLVRTGT